MQKNLHRCITRFWTPRTHGHPRARGVGESQAFIVGWRTQRAKFSPRLCLLFGVSHMLRGSRRSAHSNSIRCSMPSTHLFNNGLSEQKHVIPDMRQTQGPSGVSTAVVPSHSSRAKPSRHMSYAKHRFDSMANPVPKTAVMLLPICTWLYHQLRQPRRQGKTRACCIGIAPVYAEMLFVAWCSCRLWSDQFVRIFDCLQHDIAASELAADLTAKAGLTAHAETIARARQLKGTFVTELVRRQRRNQQCLQAPRSCWPNTKRCVKSQADVRIPGDVGAASSGERERSAQKRPCILPIRLDRPYDPGEETNGNEAHTKHNTMQIHIQ